MRETVGMFFVLEKNGSLRIFIDTRLANTFFKPPDHSKLPTPSAYTSIETDETEKLIVALGDVCNAFHHMLLPHHLHLFDYVQSLADMFRKNSGRPLAVLTISSPRVLHSPHGMELVFVLLPGFP